MYVQCSLTKPHFLHEWTVNDYETAWCPGVKTRSRVDDEAANSGMSLEMHDAWRLEDQ